MNIDDWKSLIDSKTLSRFHEKGQIENEGSFEALQEKRTDFLEFLARGEEANEDPSESKTEANPMLDFNQSNEGDAEEDEPKETEELLTKGNLPKSLYWKYLRSGSSIFMILSFLFCMILGQLGSSGCDYWVGYWWVQKEGIVINNYY